MSSSVLATPVATTTPLNGALGYDIAQPNALFVGNGTSFVNVSDGDPNNVKGPASAVSGDLASFDGTTGKLIRDSNIPANLVVTNINVSVTAGDLPRFDGTTGKVIRDSNILYTNVVENTGGVVTSGNLANFGDTTGRLIQDSSIAAANVVQGPASAVSGDIATYNGTTGKLIQDSGITISSSTTASISFTSAGSNPTITGWLKLQKIATSVNSMVYFEVGIFAAPTVTTPDTWTATAVIPSGYRPANTGQIVPPVYNSTFPGTIDTDAQLNVTTAGNIVFNIRDTLTGATIGLSTFYGNYSV